MQEHARLLTELQRHQADIQEGRQIRRAGFVEDRPSGATLAYAALAQAPAATIGGAVSVDPSPRLPTKVPLCEGAPAHRVADGGFAYGRRGPLPGWWRIAAHQPLPPGLMTTLAGIEDVAVIPPDRDAIDALVEQVEAALGERTSIAVDSLPLTEIEAEVRGPFFAVIYSGDGGWRDLDKQIGEFLAKHGVSVIGVDSLRYFWTEKSPDRGAQDLKRIIDTYSTRWSYTKVVLIGYSFGAAVLPFAVNRLPADTRADVVQVSLLGLESRASFVIRISGWLGAVPGVDAPEVLPEVQRMNLATVQCFYGQEEQDTLCRSAALRSAEIITTTGGHHFDGDYAALAEKILRGAQVRASKHSPTPPTARSRYELRGYGV